MFYAVRHFKQFRYDSPVSESLMEVRMHPRSEGPQRCLNFHLSVDPRAQVNSYRDYLGNSVHHFDVPRKHMPASHHRRIDGGSSDSARIAVAFGCACDQY